MKTATGLALVAIGAILAFAVTGHPGWLNVQAAGWVLMLVGLAGMFVPRRGYGWLKRRVVRRPAASRRTVLTSNGLTSNGLTSNGLTSNGPASNGPASNGPASNGPPSNGPASNGPASNGPASNGPASDGPADATALPAGTVVLTPEQAAQVQAGALEPEVFPGRQLSKAEAEAQMAPASPLTSTSETIEEYLEE